MGQVLRKTYKYVYKIGNKVKHIGITKDLSRREKEHKAEWPTGHVSKIGRRTTRNAAKEWARGKR